MAVTSHNSSVLELLPYRTLCGTAFDRLTHNTEDKSCTVVAGPIKLSWHGHHRVPEMTPWSVAWCNGNHFIALSLKPSPAAWTFTRCYFDRLPLPLARSLIAVAFQPLLATLNSGPWVTGAITDATFLDGGANVIASTVPGSDSFAFELAFSNAEAARSTAQSFDTSKHVLLQADILMPCEVHLGQLKLDCSQVQKLRIGDVLLGAVHSASSSSQSESSLPLHATLKASYRKRTLAAIRYVMGQWEVLNVSRRSFTEHSMDDEVFFNDETVDGISTRNTGVDDSNWNPQGLMVCVEVVACRVNLGIAAIQALRIGDVLDMTNSLGNASIEIRVSGRPFAKGTLVALEGRLAVQLAKFENVQQTTERSL